MRLDLNAIHKCFGPVHANKGINLTVGSGTIHGLLGENGAGKSTFMKILSGFIRRDSGEILLDGKPVEFKSPAGSNPRRHLHVTPVPTRFSTDARNQ